MKNRLRLTAFMLALLFSSMAINAQDAENAETPTDLAKLLPEGGLGEGIDFYLLMNSPVEEGSMSQRWSIKPDGDKINFTVEMKSGDGEFSFHNIKTLVYAKTGQLLSYRSVDHFGEGVRTTTGEAKDGKLIITSTQAFDDPDFAADEVQGLEGREIDLKELEGKIPMQWLPLLFRYHIREGNLGYSVITIDDFSFGATSTATFEDNGTETVAFNGKKHKAHSLTVTVKHEPDPDPDFPVERPEQTKLRMQVLEDGSIFSMRMADGAFEMHAKRATAKEVAEAMKQDKQAAPGEFEGEEAEGAVRE